MTDTSLFGHIQLMSDIFLGAWHFYYLHILVTIFLFTLVVLPKLPPNNTLIRNNLRVISLIAVLILMSGMSVIFGWEKLAAVMDELAQLIAGMLLIHVAGQLVYLVLFPMLNLDPPRILQDILIVLVYVAWIMVRLRYAGLDLSSLVTTSAVMTAIIAFSMQETLSNILGGLALQTDKSINIGDWIKVDDVSGRIVQVTWRHTAVRTRNGERVILPNSLLMKAKFSIVGSEDVQQWRRWIHFSISDSVQPQRIINTINQSLIDASIPNVSKSPVPQCLVMDFVNGIAMYSLRYWLTDPNLDDPTDSEVRLHIYTTLKRHGYPLVHPVMDVSITENSSEREQLLRAQEVTLREKTLRKIDLFRDLSNEEIHHIATTLIYAPFARGSVITHQGAVAHWLYVLISGEVDIWNESPGKNRQHLAMLNQGSIFGERGLMTGEPRRATVTARTDVECYRIDKQSLETVMQSRPELAEAFANILASRSQQHVKVDDKPKISHENHVVQLLEKIQRFFRLE